MTIWVNYDIISVVDIGVIVMDDIYLNLAVEMYENGTWNEEIFKRKVLLYAKDKGLDDKVIADFLSRVVKPKEMSISEKIEYLSKLTFDGVELKYGDVIEEMSDENIEKFYEMEVASLSKEQTNVKQSKKIEKKLVNLDEMSKTEEKTNDETNTKEMQVSEEKKEAEYIKEEDSILKVSIEDIKNGNYTADDLLGITEKDADELFEALVSVVKPEDFNKVLYSLREKLGKDYSSTFAIEWAKKHSNDMDKVNLEENKVVEAVVPETEPEVEEIYIEEANKNEEVIIPEINFEELDIPETEEEFTEQAENITSKEEDSNVTKVEASSERINKLKKNKGKIINYFLKTAIVVAAVSLLTFPSAAASIGGYLYFSNKIKNGNFNPENPVGKAVKHAVEKIMYMGMNKEDIENEKGKTR